MAPKDRPVMTGKRLRDLLVDYYSQHDPQRLVNGFDVNGVVKWTLRNGISALNTVLKKEMGHALDINKDLGNQKDRARRVSMLYKRHGDDLSSAERELSDRLHRFYLKHDPSKINNISKMMQFALYNGETALDIRLREKYNEGLPAAEDINDTIREARPNVNLLTGEVIPNVPSTVDAITYLYTGKAKPSQSSSGEDDDDSPNESSFEEELTRQAMLNRNADDEEGAPPLPPRVFSKPKKRRTKENEVKRVHDKRKKRRHKKEKRRSKDHRREYNQIATQLRRYYDYFDPEKIEALEEYMSLFESGGKEALNNHLENVYGHSLQHFVENETMFLKTKRKKRSSFSSSSDEADSLADEIIEMTKDESKRKEEELTPKVLKEKSFVERFSNNRREVAKQKFIGFTKGIKNFVGNAKKPAPTKHALKKPLKTNNPFTQFKPEVVKGDRAAARRFSLAPNAFETGVTSPLHATPEEGACGNYRLDMVGKSVGVCVCGYPKVSHTASAKFGKNRKNLWAHVSAEKNPTNHLAGSQTALFRALNKSDGGGSSRQFSAEKQNKAFTPKVKTSESKQKEESVTEKILKLQKEKEQEEGSKTKRSRLNRFVKKAKTVPTGKSSPRVEKKDLYRSMVVRQNVKQNSSDVSEEGGPCGNFRLDINGKYHGDCVCGYSKVTHVNDTRLSFIFESQKKNAQYQKNLSSLKKSLHDSHARLTFKMNPMEVNYATIGGLSVDRPAIARSSPAGTSVTSLDGSVRRKGKSRKVKRNLGETKDRKRASKRVSKHASKRASKEERRRSKKGMRKQASASSYDSGANLVKAFEQQIGGSSRRNRFRSKSSQGAPIDKAQIRAIISSQRFPQVVEMNIKTCEKCGQTSENRFKFCTHCGARL